MSRGRRQFFADPEWFAFVRVGDVLETPSGGFLVRHPLSVVDQPAIHGALVNRVSRQRSRGQMAVRRRARQADDGAGC